MEKNRNYMVAIALSALIVLAWQFLYMNPRLAERRAAEAQLAAQTKVESSEPGAAAPATPAASGTTTTAAPAADAASAGIVSREEAIASTMCIEIDTPSITGSLNLAGARLDDVRLKG